MFAYITWLYRLMVFLGIAVLVYHFFFKLLGIVMFVLELFWFIFRPIWKELGYLWRSRKAVRLPWRPAVAVLAVAGVVVWVIPVSHEVTAPAILRAQHEHAVYAPFPAKITEVRVAERQKVAAGTELIRLEALELGVREKKADIGIASARAELARMPANIQLQENFQVLQQRLAQAVAEKQAVAEEFNRQQLRSAQDGTIRDVAPDLVAGRWVSPQQLLMRVVSQSEPVIEAYVTEQQVAALAPGQTVRFFPRQADRPVLEGRVLVGRQGAAEGAAAAAARVDLRRRRGRQAGPARRADRAGRGLSRHGQAARRRAEGRRGDRRQRQDRNQLPLPGGKLRLPHHLALHTGKRHLIPPR